MGNIVLVPCNGQVPERKHEDDAGADVRAAEDVTINPGTIATVRTGLHIALPGGYVALFFARSGNGVRGIGFANGVGVIDAGYRGEIKATLINNGVEPFEVRAGDRIGQLVIIKLPIVRFFGVGEDVFSYYCNTSRGFNGFGSTGKD